MMIADGFSSIASAINIIVTTVTMRAKGMSWFRMPIFVWAAVAAAIIQFTATQTVGVALMMSIAERALGLNFFDPVGVAYKTVPQAFKKKLEELLNSPDVTEAFQSLNRS